MKLYNKLVRDKIPDIIAGGGSRPEVRILEGEEYLRYLEMKLDEEVGEYHKDKNAEELADILEVVFALAEAIGCPKEELMRVYQNKKDARGGFRQGYFLVGVAEGEEK